MSDSPSSGLVSKQRLQTVRRLGITPRSPELTAGAVLLTAAWIGHSSFPAMGQALQGLMSHMFGAAGTSIHEFSGDWNPAWMRVGLEVLRLVTACWAAALVSDLVQVGFVWSPATPFPHGERVSLVSGMERLFSVATLERATLLLLKVLLALAIGVALSERGVQALRSDLASESHLAAEVWGRGVHWTCLVLASAGGSCVLFGAVDAWLRQSRWRVSIQQTEDERRRGD